MPRMPMDLSLALHPGDVQVLALHSGAPTLQILPSQLSMTTIREHYMLMCEIGA